MRQIQLTKGFMASVDDADFERVNQHSWQVNIQRRKDGSIRGIYAQRWNDGSIELMHRFILGDEAKDRLVDHKDRDGLNNQRENIRVCEQWQNSANSKAHRNNTSGHKGVSWHKLHQKWEVKIRVRGKRHNLGMFDEKQDAVAAYAAAAKNLAGEFARS